MTALTVALINLGLLAVAAAAVGPSDVPKAAPRSWKVDGLPASKVVGPDPIILKVAADAELTNALKAAVADGRKGTIRLLFGGLDLADPKVGIKVYVNIPADRPLPAADSDHYVGMVGGFGKPDKGDYAIDLAPALRRLAAKKEWASGDPITITLAAAPASPRQKVADPKATLERVTVEVPAAK